MRLSILPILLTGVGLANLVAAEPIRVPESPSSANANIRFGLALANANVNGNDGNIARVVVVRPSVPLSAPEGNDGGLSRHFCGSSMREKAIRLSNAFRHALGMPLIETDAAVPKLKEIHILPSPFSPHNVMLHPHEEMAQEGNHGEHRVDDRHRGDGEHDGRHRHHGHHHGHRKSFIGRIHKAIRALGPWEGRAVAFVLGCGIGVLMRMFWVLSVLAYRTVRGERDQDPFEREYIVYEQLPDITFAAPPQYVSEKVEAHREADECK